MMPNVDAQFPLKKGGVDSFRAFRNLVGCSLLAFGAMAVSSQAQAQMILTPNAVTAGFQLSTFASGFPITGGVGPLGIAFDGNRVIVSDYPGNVRVFPTDTDGQSAASVPISQNYGNHDAAGIAQAGSNYYMTQQASGRIVQINANGTFNQTILTGIAGATGIAANPANGHLFVSANQGILDINPLTRTFSVFQGVGADGLTTDGTTLYAETNNRILGYRLSDKTVIFDSGSIGDGPDGTALGYGMLAGNIFVNTNGGRLLEYNLTSAALTVIGTGGSRGDFVTVDPNGTLLLTQTDRILRLTAPAGSSFVPEPGAVSLLIGAVVPGILLLRRRQKQALRRAA